MSGKKRIKSALLSVFYKDGLEPIARKLHEDGVILYSTGGTQSFLEGLGLPVIPVESQTNYPSIFGGRVKTLHPAIFGGILHRRDNENDLEEKAQHNIPDIDMVVVDLYPFEETVASGASQQDIIEKIDIGGISLIRAAAKNFKDVLIVPSREYYAETLEVLQANNSETNLEERFRFAGYAFDISSHYDTAIHGFFAPQSTSFKRSIRSGKALRYGENPHQQGWFHGNLDEAFEQLHGKELSYNNLLDVDAAAQLIAEFWKQDPTVAVIKHNNACGLAQRSDVFTAWTDALAGDPVSAFGGIIASNVEIDGKTAESVNDIFFEVILAPSYTTEALEILKQKKNRIILVVKNIRPQEFIARTALNGVLVQERDYHTDAAEDLKTVTKVEPTEAQVKDLLFASALCKNTKSNTIVLVKDGQLLASGTGQTSRVDALRQAIQKAKSFNFDLNGAVMASDAFFPFPDCVEIAHGEGIDTVIQPGGSIKDQLSIDYCDANNMGMVFTGYRHFKH
ncbi:bifunctional phosphoribosylaminoimidazolecarboxamide formyltransferase/IMP cyclohydrolase [Phaeocystidibacter marisrubri]|uniref:Bifunctional purine biosynthesis protein PurH n=1 Tax=Phaeocystidibacter marisrubri TaxID=1577780 RepID=A0A6L3ZEK7_9FLAO|nr:bifunctional phosphoribosylaminoimidazolecarboxamide formyltransferase/IMP cyclohydrolase [Phaeocystidibacter marisrubri]KAB2815802.1 bifunctional phosphoribosylaminoimidazolecarboxamide formyltransferase/IMP cyclohydrolase [Phaeocystidibacter marisrubri]GGH65784.1 bifunctional purine biosynthesis protein PurH [Phaeocystidibacter marisrubri]